MHINNFNIHLGSVEKRPWFIGVKIIIAVLLLASGLMFIQKNSFNYILLSLYSVITLLYFLNYYGYRGGEKLLDALGIAHLSLELLLEGILVNHAGGNFSPFIIFFLLTIVTAGLSYHLIGSIIIASVSGLLYSLPIFLDLSAAFPGIVQSGKLTGLGISSDEAFYAVFLHLCIFYFFAFISGYLSENLISASKELKNIRYETAEILEQMLSGLMTIDSDGRIVYFNKAAGEILGISPDSAKNALLSEIFHPGLREFQNRIDFALAKGQPDNRAEVEIRLPLKGSVPLGLTLSALKDRDGLSRGIIAIFQDLTDAKKLEAHMRASERLAAVGRLAAGIAHEIRNPLASISGSVEVLKDELQADGENLQLLKLILKESSRLNTILADFLNYARVSKSQTKVTNLANVILEVVQLARAHNQTSNGVELKTNIHSRAIPISAGEDQLKQILWNLVLNAAESFENGAGTVEISTHVESLMGKGEMLRLTVSDNGPGIPSNLQDKIFEPFYSTKQNGTGLGLSIVARIVDCLEGRFELESEPSNGTKFHIFLPLADIKSSEVELKQEVALK